MWKYHGRPAPIGYINFKWAFRDRVLNFNRWFGLSRYQQIAIAYEVYPFYFSFKV